MSSELETMKAGLLVVGTDGNLIGRYIGARDTEIKYWGERFVFTSQKGEVLALRSRARGVLESSTRTEIEMINKVSMVELIKEFLIGKLDFIVCQRKIAEKFPEFYKKYNLESFCFILDHHCKAEYVVMSAWRGESLSHF